MKEVCKLFDAKRGLVSKFKINIWLIDSKLGNWNLIYISYTYITKKEGLSLSLFLLLSSWLFTQEHILVKRVKIYISKTEISMATKASFRQFFSLKLTEKQDLILFRLSDVICFILNARLNPDQHMLHKRRNETIWSSCQFRIVAARTTAWN